MPDLKTETINGVRWSTIERFSVQGVNFLVQIIIARLLIPEDYGIIGMLAVFMQIAQVFIDSGFANALIQKKNCSEQDYSTVFYFGLVLSCLIYGIFYIGAPFISRFYNMPVLVGVTRVLAITLVLNALPVIHKTKLVKDINFKTQSNVSFISAALSGILGIYLAYRGMGVWSLCAQQIAYSTFQIILYFIAVHWWPREGFSRNSFNELFGFGSKILASSLINTLYRNLYTLVIGKFFSAEKLGYFSRAEQFAQFPSSNLANIFSRVAFPVFSKIQDDNAQLRQAYKKIIRYSSLIIFPLMFGLIALADPFICVVLTEKWKGAVVLLQILCLDWMLDHITAINLNLLYVKGRSDYALKLEIVKKTIAVIILLATVPFGLVVMCWGKVAYSVIATVLNTHYTKLLIGLSFFDQLKDFRVFMLFASIMCLAVMAINTAITNQYLQLVIGVVSGSAIYCSLLFFFARKDFKYCLDLISHKRSIS